MARLNGAWLDFTRRGQAWDSFWQDGPTPPEADSGALSSLQSEVAGDGISESTGSGDLRAQATTLVGADAAVIISAGHAYIGPRGLPKEQTRLPLAIGGSGTLRAGRTRVAGIGQVTWEDQNALALLLLAA